MKRFLCMTLAVIMIVFPLVGCKNKNAQTEVADNTVVINVDSAYVDSFADDYAKEKVDTENGAVKYTFTKENYDKFLTEFEENVKEQAKTAIDIEYDYWLCDYENHQLVFGISESTYTSLGDEALKQSAEKVADIAIKYDMYTQNPTGELEVIYRNTTTSDTLYSFTYSK